MSVLVEVKSDLMTMTFEIREQGLARLSCDEREWRLGLDCEFPSVPLNNSRENPDIFRVSLKECLVIVVTLVRALAPERLDMYTNREEQHTLS